MELGEEGSSRRGEGSKDFSALGLDYLISWCPPCPGCHSRHQSENPPKFRSNKVTVGPQHFRGCLQNKGQTLYLEFKAEVTADLTSPVFWSSPCWYRYHCSFTRVSLPKMLFPICSPPSTVKLVQWYPERSLDIFPSLGCEIFKKEGWAMFQSPLWALCLARYRHK